MPPVAPGRLTPADVPPPGYRPLDRRGHVSVRIGVELFDVGMACPTAYVPDSDMACECEVVEDGGDIFAIGQEADGCHLRAGDRGPWASAWAGMPVSRCRAGPPPSRNSHRHHRDPRSPGNLAPVAALEGRQRRHQGGRALALRTVRGAALELAGSARFAELMDKYLPAWRSRQDRLNGAPLAEEDWY